MRLLLKKIKWYFEGKLRCYQITRLCKEIDRARKGVRITTKKELCKHSLTAGELIDFIYDNHIPFHAPVLVQRIEDAYYKRNGWSVYPKDQQSFEDEIPFQTYYSQAWACARYKDDQDVLFIDLHY